MTTTEKQYVEKLKELFLHVIGSDVEEQIENPNCEKCKTIGSELASLEQQIKTEENIIELFCEKHAITEQTLIDVYEDNLERIMTLVNEKTVNDEEIKKEIVKLTVMVNECGMSALGALMTLRDFMKDKLLNK